MTRAPSHLARVVTLLAALAGAAACSRPSADSGHRTVAVDEGIVAYLSIARARHHEANVREAEGDLRGALAALDALVAAPKPHPGERLPEVEEVLADAHARRADTLLRLGDFDAAEVALTAGLGHAPEGSYFQGHLIEVQGIAAELSAARLADAGSAEEAARHRARAIELLARAVRIQEGVVARALADDSGAPR